MPGSDGEADVVIAGVVSLIQRRQPGTPKLGLKVSPKAALWSQTSTLPASWHVPGHPSTVA
jgi:hypothetical protein